MGIINFFGGRKAFLTTIIVALGTLAYYVTPEKNFIYLGVFYAVCLVAYGYLNVKTKDIELNKVDQCGKIEK